MSLALSLVLPMGLAVAVYWPLRKWVWMRRDFYIVAVAVAAKLCWFCKVLLPWSIPDFMYFACASYGILLLSFNLLQGIGVYDT
jgi:hypothetical protein